MIATLLSVQVVQSVRIGLDTRRMQAEQTLGNLADRILVADPADLNDATLAAWADEAKQVDQLPVENIEVVIHPESNPIAGRRFELVWHPESKQMPQHRLVVWRFDAPNSKETEQQP
ncbi:hypothetical protein C5Y93_08725 [Blastopirellula marina]|uniref:Uncharacterized protein n=2 Tax=Blastopirellula marina TaxID=124 RepID=A0A2S8GQ44_9BACT|nr:hypothetical protein C5Y93_08725 [Blastopirellula marina]